MRYPQLTYYLLTFLTSMMCLTGCIEDRLIDENKAIGEKAIVEAHLFLSLSMPEGKTRTANTATLPGTDTENKIKKLTLFIMDTEYSNIQDYTVEDQNGLDKSLYFNVGTTEGDKYIYVGVNMTNEQINKLKTNWNSPQTLSTSIDELTEVNGFLMTAQAVAGDGGSKTINIAAHKVTNITAGLNRVMAKVLLTCHSEDGIYVKLSENSKGYIRLADVHYELETTNKKFYLFEKDNNEDPNYSMTETLGQNFDDNFFAFSGKVEESKNVAIQTDASRLSDTNPYKEGIYCLENTVSVDSDYGNDLSYPKKVATYLKIAARFTPMYIDSESKLSEKEATEKLTNGTFYICKKAPEGKKHICYSSIESGITFLGGGISKNDFIEHTGGWQNYETFVTSPVTFTETSNLRRNNYYIVNVTSMNAPIQDKTIEVSTTIAAWTVKGKTTVDIETGK